MNDNGWVSEERKMAQGPALLFCKSGTVTASQPATLCSVRSFHALTVLMKSHEDPKGMPIGQTIKLRRGGKALA